MFQSFKKSRRAITTIVLFCFVLTQVVSGVFLYARPAEAQLVVSDPVTGAQTTIKNIKDFLKVLVVNAGTMALINAASRFMQKLSYDLAVSLASGGNGQMPLFSTEGWGDYLANAGLDAAGEFIGSFGDMVYFFKYKKGREDFIIDIAEDGKNLNDSTIGLEKSGVIILGSGVVKHSILHAHLYRNGADYAVYINTAEEFDGSDSGANPDEAVSWGKIRKNAESVKVHGDATIIFPLIVAKAFVEENIKTKDED